MRALVTPPTSVAAPGTNTPFANRIRPSASGNSTITSTPEAVGSRAETVSPAMAARIAVTVVSGSGSGSADLWGGRVVEFYGRTEVSLECAESYSSDVRCRHVGELFPCIVGGAYRRRGRDTARHHGQHTERQEATSRSM